MDGGLYKFDEPERRESYAVLPGRAGRDELAAEGSAPMPFELMHWSMHSYGAQFCEVRVNAVTGEPRVSRFLGSFDCGRILNAKTAASQFRGGIIMGLGLALTEETQFDERNGRIMNPSLAEYHVPVHMDVPEIDVIWTDIPDPHAPMGAHGVGEIGITGVGAAVANAVYNATGKRVRDLPPSCDTSPTSSMNPPPFHNRRRSPASPFRTSRRVSKTKWECRPPNINSGRASRKLAAGKHTVTEIAFGLGFSSSQCFATVYKRFTRESPSARSH